MPKARKFNALIRALFALLSAGLVWSASAAVSLHPPETFFTTIADRLLRQQLGLRLTEVQIAPTNQYDSAVHRIFQVTANIYDATTTNDSPAVFRPLFNVTSNGVFLAGFTNDSSVSTFPAWLESNPYGVPMVIAARKGIPNFNEFTVRTDVSVRRKLQVTRAAPFPGSTLTGTNQMYLVSVSNYFGLESWNSASRRFFRAVDISISNYTTFTMKNELGVQATLTNTQVTRTNVASSIWGGFNFFAPGSPNSFLVALQTNQVLLNNAVYNFTENHFADSDTNTFGTESSYPLPDWKFAVSNRLVYVMSEGDRILDCVLLSDSSEGDLYRLLITSPSPYNGLSGVPSSMHQVWNTNRIGATTGPTAGILAQMDISLGHIPFSITEWRAFSPAAFASENDKYAAINSFRNFYGLVPLTSGPYLTNSSLMMEAPFSPVARMIVQKTWRANDPLAHSHTADLAVGINTNRQYFMPFVPGTNIWPASIGRLNEEYSPWAGNPLSSSFPEFDNRTIKDPGVYGTDWWSFPSNAPLAIDWIGRIHRGTPWQSIYLKADGADEFEWWQSRGDLRAHPTNDWRMAALLAELFNTNDVRTWTSINTTNLSVWTDTFSGLRTLTNTTSEPIFWEPVLYETNIMDAASPQITNILAGIHRRRTSMPGQYFPDVAAFLATPELSNESPWLNLDPEQQHLALTDVAYEILPSQLLARVRRDPVATVDRSGSALTLRFNVFDGYAYRVESSDDGWVWNTVSEPHHSTNGVFTVTLSASNSHQFYRAVLP